MNEHHVVVHGFDTRDHCVYDLDGHPSQISLGALLETMSIAASAHGLRMKVYRRPESPETNPTFDTHFEADPHVQPDTLIPYIRYRSVQRRPLSTRPLTSHQKMALESCVGSNYQILWLEGFAKRLQAARLMFNNAKLRLIMPEAYQVHCNIIQWNSRYSEDRIPDQALGIDQVTAHLMRWVMKSWRRVEFFNTFLAGTWAPRIQMDLLPGVGCAAHFVILASQPPQSIDDYISAGRAMQRFWLTSAKLGLQLQPEITPLIFARYSRGGVRFSTKKQCVKLADILTEQLNGIIDEKDAAEAVFMGRIGSGKVSASRSTRMSLQQLMWRP
jgi:hypothetical protein